MWTHRDYLAERERRKDEMARAARYRLSRPVPAMHRRLLAALGELLVTWGHWLVTTADAVASM
jgi:hypothetical protein